LTLGMVCGKIPAEKMKYERGGRMKINCIKCDKEVSIWYNQLIMRGTWTESWNLCSGVCTILALADRWLHGTLGNSPEAIKITIAGDHIDVRDWR
jgi:hypothetical protein